MQARIFAAGRTGALEASRYGCSTHGRGLPSRAYRDHVRATRSGISRALQTTRLLDRRRERLPATQGIGANRYDGRGGRIAHRRLVPRPGMSAPAFGEYSVREQRGWYLYDWA